MRFPGVEALTACVGVGREPVDGPCSPPSLHVGEEVLGDLPVASVLVAGQRVCLDVVDALDVLRLETQPSSLCEVLNLADQRHQLVRS